jgi:hypothetical protein
MFINCTFEMQKLLVFVALGMKDDEEMDGSRKWRTSKNSFHGSLSN